MLMVNGGFFYLEFKVSDTFTTNTMSNTLTHLLCPGVILSSDTTISQILAMLHNSGISLATPCITLSLVTAATCYINLLNRVSCDKLCLIFISDSIAKQNG